jgi:hypothetical protein
MDVPRTKKNKKTFSNGSRYAPFAFYTFFKPVERGVKR